MCLKLDLIEGNIFFTDGSKFRANASINNTRTKEGCEQYLKKIEEQIDQVINESEQIDAQEQDDRSLIKLKEQIHDKAKLMNTMKDVLNTLDSQDKDNINTTDEDSVKAKSRQGTHAVYNVQSTVDGKHGLIVHAKLSAKAMIPTASASRSKKPLTPLGKNPSMYAPMLVMRMSMILKKSIKILI